ncbi:hypothetical protein [Phytoactinopolyspora mesophila]|uniref:Mycothiol-dependent maleylpyruvate isomerase metal-binding domain-containing protein n=1 Tax=Phytoactinopolyspora mesophila TaxID=2650750 RepID=A0A7K3M8W4_9ACTN|nr:hypothetical protein [Phytoactinopolyspora mesophila]NDL59755.1 hypothetical protein [Phytoactinopolyspora mesophila]
MRLDPAPVTPEDVELAGTIVIDALAGSVEADWSLSAGGLSWSCWATLAHVCDCLISYTGQLADRAETDYVPFVVRVKESASPAGLLRVVRVAAGLLAAVCRSTPEDVRAYHPSGMADPEGFAAMGVAELLVHGNDVAHGLGVSFHVEPGLASRVLARLFPRTAIADDDPWQVLLWAHGRIRLPGRVQANGWTWTGAPIGERD